MYKEKDCKTVSILGTDYKIVFVTDNDKRLVSRNADWCGKKEDGI